MNRYHWVILSVAVVFCTHGWVEADEPGTPYQFTANFTSVAGLTDFVMRGQEPQGRAEIADFATAQTRTCGPCWTFRGEFLLLRPGNDKVAFAVPINGAIVPPAGVAPVQVGREVLVDESFGPGFRVGGERLLTECSTLGLEFTWFGVDRSNDAVGTAAFPLRSLVNHPGSVSAATDSLDAVASGHIDFQLGDALYRRFLIDDEIMALSLVGGVRFGHIDEEFRSTFTSSAAIETVDTDITFDGAGLRLGIEAERRATCSGLIVYGKGYASFMGGEFTTRYTQADNTRGTVVDTGWVEDRAISILDIELGLGWVSRCGGLRLTSGYTFSGWYNVINTDDFIRAVRTSDSVNVRDHLSFDGFVVRAEARF